MDFFQNLCISEKERDDENEMPKEIFVAIIFQNIAYTSSSNYKKWFFNTFKYKHSQTIKRERRYSLDENIDFDVCQTERSINKTDSMETIYENFFYDNEPLNVYYLPFSQQILPYFEKYIDYMNPNIISKKINQGKIKYFEKSNKLFISFMFDKHIQLSNKQINVKIGKNTMKISKTIHNIWEYLQNSDTLYNILQCFLNNDEVIIVSHYKNCIFTDYILYQLVQLFSVKIKYCSIAFTKYYPQLFYEKLDKIIDMYNFDGYYKTKNYIEINKNSTFNFCNYNSQNYRKNLKQLSIKILQNLS